MIGSPQDAPTIAAHRWYRVIPYVLCGISIPPSIVWIALDESVWMWDQAWYGQIACELWRTLITSPMSWPGAMLSALAAKPPLLPWAGQFFVPTAQIFGKIETALLLGNIVFNVVSIFAIAKVCGRIAIRGRFPQSIGILTAISGPLFIGLTNQFFVEPAQTAIVSLTWLLALQCSAMPSRQVMWLGASLVFVGVACKATTPLYAIAPGYLILTDLLKKRDWTARFTLAEGGLAICAIILGTAICSWYAKNMTYVIQHIRDASGEENALYYGWIDSFPAKFLTWIGLFQQCFLTQPIFIVLGIMFCGTIVLLLMRGSLQREDRLIVFLIVLALGQIFVVLAFFASNIVVEPRYIEPLVPTVAILVAAICALLPSIVSAAFAATLIVQFVFVEAISFGLAPPSSLVTTWVRKIERDPTDKKIMLYVIATTCGSPGDGNKYNIIGVEYPELNANSASFYSAAQAVRVGWQCQYTSLGYAAKEVAPELARIRALQINYFVSVPPKYQKKVDFLNEITSAVLERIGADPDYEKIVSENDRVVIFQRRMQVR